MSARDSVAGMEKKRARLRLPIAVTVVVLAATAVVDGCKKADCPNLGGGSGTGGAGGAGGAGGGHGGTPSDCESTAAFA